MVKRFCDICEVNELESTYSVYAVMRINIEYHDEDKVVYFNDICKQCFNELNAVIFKNRSK